VTGYIANSGSRNSQSVDIDQRPNYYTTKTLKALMANTGI